MTTIQDFATTRYSNKRMTTKQEWIYAGFLMSFATIVLALWLTRNIEPTFNMNPSTPDYHQVTSTLSEGICTVAIEGHTIDMNTMQPIQHIHCNVEGHAGL